MAIYNSAYTGAEVDASVAKTQAITKTPQQINNLNQVTANPTLAGTEADLTGLQVGDTKYAVPQGGGNLYLHSVRIDKNSITSPGMKISFFIYIISKNSTQFTTISDLFTYLATIPLGAGTAYFPIASGYCWDSTNTTSNSTRPVYMGYYTQSSNYFVIYFTENDGDGSSETITTNSTTTLFHDYVSTIL